MGLSHVGINWDDTIAFGDSKNDIEMIEFVATGVAMADARPEVLRVSDMVTPPAGEDGLAQAFSVLGLL